MPAPKPQIVQVQNVSVSIDITARRVVLSPMSPKSCYDLGRVATVLRAGGIAVHESASDTEIAVALPLGTQQVDAVRA